MVRNSPEYNREYYQRTKEKRKDYIKDRQRRIKDEIQAYKLERGCLYCGYKRCARALEFHHEKEHKKDKGIAVMVGQGRSIKSIMKEIEKCVVVCSNCHVELHEGILGSSSSG